jgi:hypothetical protein
MQVAWNKATSFALAGYLLAGVIAWAYVGWFWAYLPGLLVALLTGYGTSTWLGSRAERKSTLLGCLLAGVGVAVVTLCAGVIALGVTNILLAWVDGVTSAGWGYGPLKSVAKVFEGYILRPLLTVLAFGGWIAFVLGVAYGASLYSRKKVRPRWS